MSVSDHNERKDHNSRNGLSGSNKKERVTSTRQKQSGSVSRTPNSATRIGGLRNVKTDNSVLSKPKKKSNEKSKVKSGLNINNITDDEKTTRKTAVATSKSKAKRKANVNKVPTWADVANSRNLSFPDTSHSTDLRDKNAQVHAKREKVQGKPKRPVTASKVSRMKVNDERRGGDKNNTLGKVTKVGINKGEAVKDSTVLDERLGLKSNNSLNDREIVNRRNNLSRSDRKSGKTISKDILKKSLNVNKNLKSSDSKVNANIKNDATLNNSKSKKVNKPSISRTRQINQRHASRSLFNKSVVAAMLSAVVLLVLILITYHFYNYIAVKPKQSFISNGSIQHTIGAKALIIRDENVIESPKSGTIVGRATEGERVAVGKSLAIVVPDDMEDTLSDLHNVESQISDVQQELLKSSEVDEAKQVFDEIDALILPNIDLIRKDAMQNDISNLYSYSSSLDVLISQREEKLVDVDFNDERLTSLNKEKKNNEERLGGVSTLIKASTTGITSFKVDGNESEYDFKFAEEAEPQDIVSAIQKADDIMPSVQTCEEGDGIVRITGIEQQYFAVLLDASEVSAQAFDVDTKHDINIPSKGINILGCNVIRATQVEKGLLIVFSTSKNVKDIVDLRSVDIEIVMTENTGLKVSVSSLIDLDYEQGLAYIYINNSGFVDKVGVRIEDYDREFAIIAPLGEDTVPNLSTVIITNPSSTKVDAKVKG